MNEYLKEFIDFIPINESIYTNPNIELRPANKSDVPNMTQWEVETVLAEYPNKKPSSEEYNNIKKAMHEDAKSSVNKTRMILHKDKVIGMITAYDVNVNNKTYWYIGEIYIIKSFRNRGIGTMILENEIKQHERLMLNVYKTNVNGIRLYKSLGFTVYQESDGRYIMTFYK